MPVLAEFKAFLVRGNLIELAVAFVMGVAFAAVITAFVDYLVMPIIAAIFGKPNFNDLTFTIHHSVFQYGAFITALITFVSIAAAVFFFVVKPVQMIRARGATDEDELAPTDEERRHQELVATIRSISR